MKKILYLLSFSTLVNFAKAQTKDTLKTSSDTTIYRSVDQVAEFPGGRAALHTYLRDSIKYAAGDTTVGSVAVMFVVEKDGSLTNFEIKRSLNQVDDAEAIRVLSTCPKWTPAVSNGYIVRMSMVFVISFDPVDKK
jgi:protein TonB